MCARARPPARTTAQAAVLVRRVEARAPALAAAATCPLCPADLVQPDLADLLKLVARCASQQAAGVTLREARVVGEDTDTAVALLISLARRIMWRGPLAASHPASGRILGRLVPGQEVLQALCGLLATPFSVDAGPDRRTAVREAGAWHRHCAPRPAAVGLPAAPGPSTASVRAQVCAARYIRPGRRPGHVVGGPGGEHPGQGGALSDPCSARRLRARPATGALLRPRPAASRSARAAPQRAARRAGGCAVVPERRTGGVGRRRSTWGGPPDAVPLRHVGGVPVADQRAAAAAAPRARDRGGALDEPRDDARGCRPGARGPRNLPMPAAPAASADRAPHRAPQHLCAAALLYYALVAAGEAPHAAYLAAFCGAASGDLLVTVMEQALLGGRGARLSGLGRRGGRRAAGSARAEARRRAGRRRPHSGAHALGDDCAWHRVRDPGVH